MHGQEIHAGFQKTNAVGDVDGRLDLGRIAGAGGAGDRVPLRIAREVAAAPPRPPLRYAMNPSLYRILSTKLE